MSRGDDLWSAAEEQIPAIKGWKPFVFAIIAAFAGGYFIKDRLATDTIASLTAKSEAATQQTDLYKAKLQIGSPDEALKKFADLEQRIQALQPRQPRHLSESEKKDLAVALAPIVNSIPELFVFFEGSGEELRYALDFADSLKAAGIKSLGPTQGYATGNDNRGIMVGLKDTTMPSDVALKFIDALHKCGFVVTTTRWPADPDPGASDFSLFIGN